MTSVDIPINEIDYDALFVGFDSVSNNTVCKDAFILLK